MEINIKNNDEVFLKDYVNNSKDSLFYTSSDFINLVSTHLGAECYWIVAKEDNEILGVLPFLESKAGKFGTVFNSLPYYGSNGGVIQSRENVEAKQNLIKEFFSLAKKKNACSATIVTNPLLKDNHLYEEVIDDHIIDERIGQITHIPANPDDELIKIFDDPRPRNIRRAHKEGIKVSSGNERSSVEFLYQIHVENMQTIGGLNKSWDFFEKLLTNMPADMWSVYIGSKEDEPVSALLLFYFNGTVEYFTPVIKSEHRNTQALALVIFEAMKDAANKRGCKNWNWGGTWLSQTGVYDFKKRWGTSDYPYYYYTKLFNKSVRSSSKEVLLKDYPGFFVLPFTELEETENE